MKKPLITCLLAVTVSAAPPVNPGKPAKPFAHHAPTKTRDAALVADVRGVAGLSSNQAVAFVAGQSEQTKKALYRDAVERSIAAWLAQSPGVIGTKVRYLPPTRWTVDATNATHTITGVSNQFVICYSPAFTVVAPAEAIKGLLP